MQAINLGEDSVLQYSHGIEDLDIMGGSINGDLLTFDPTSSDWKSSKSVIVMDYTSGGPSCVFNSKHCCNSLLRYSLYYNPLEESITKVKAFLKDNKVMQQMITGTNRNGLKRYIRHVGYRD